MAKVVIENLTDEQAKTFVHWFSEQGINQSDEWFDIADVEYLRSDMIHIYFDKDTV